MICLTRKQLLINSLLIIDARIRCGQFIQLSEVKTREGIVTDRKCQRILLFVFLPTRALRSTCFYTILSQRGTKLLGKTIIFCRPNLFLVSISVESRRNSYCIQFVNSYSKIFRINLFIRMEKPAVNSATYLLYFFDKSYGVKGMEGKK